MDNKISKIHYFTTILINLSFVEFNHVLAIDVYNRTKINIQNKFIIYEGMKIIL